MRIMKKILIFAVAVLAAVACSRTYEVKETASVPIGFGTWTETLTKVPKTDFAVNDIFDVFGYKWKGAEESQTDATTVFDGIDVKKTDATTWTYAGIGSQTAKYWDPSFAGYTFYAAYPNDILSTAPPQTGLFITNELTYDGLNEQLLIADKKTVVSGNNGNAVDLKFEHCGALVDFKFKKHSDLQNCAVSVTSFSLANIRTKGTFEVASYDGSSNKPVGATVASVTGLGWTPDDANTVNTTGTPYAISSAATSAANATAQVDLISNLVVMPQQFATGDGAQTFTIEYTITDESSQVNTYTPAAIEIKSFDLTDDTQNDSTVGQWMPGYHYTYIITINANSIKFSASIENWAEESNAHYYLIN